MFDRLRQPVHVGDLIMVFPSRLGVQAADLWVVRSCPDERVRYARTDSIMVSMGRYSRLPRAGRWILDGPEVRYIPDPEEKIEDVSVKSLKEILRPLARTYTQFDDVTIEVNPHGR